MPYATELESKIEELRHLSDSDGGLDCGREPFKIELQGRGNIDFNLDNTPSWPAPVRDGAELLGNARVVGLRMAYAHDMGFTPEELAFVLAGVEAAPRGSVDGPRLIEVGCGAGGLLVELASRGYRSVRGVDLSPAAMSWETSTDPLWSPTFTLTIRESGAMP